MAVITTDVARTKIPTQIHSRPSVTLSNTVERSVEGYLDQLDENSVSNLFELLLDEVREPMLRAVLQKLRGNQSAAARIMGVSRGTLRKLMKRYQMLD